jgi:hypothetical protein
MKAMFSGNMPGMPAMPGMATAARRASKSARKKGNKKKASRSGDPRRAAELASGGGGGGGGGQPDQAGNGPGQLSGGLPNLGSLPEGMSENLAEQLSKLPSGGLNFPPQGPQGNIPAAFRGGGKRKKK